jgi:hypothetical protein
MANYREITHDRMRQLLAYDPETGKLTWLRRPLSEFKDGEKSAESTCARWNSRLAGKEAFTASRHGYRIGTVLGVKSVAAHRLIWLLMTGEWPQGHIDHIDGDTTNNRWRNLRDVEPGENWKNTKRPSDNTSGRIGVARTEPWGWQAYINIDKKRVSLGRFRRFEDACTARAAAERKAGYHPNHGR